MNDIYKLFKELSNEFEDLTKALMYKKMVKSLQEIKEESDDAMTYDILIDAFNDAIKYRTKCELEGKAEEKWIPTSERLPEKDEVVLITNKWHEVDKALYIGDEMFDIIINYLQKEEVIAWMPLPERYKESEDE